MGIGEAIDSVIGTFAPQWGAQRSAYRAAMRRYRAAEYDRRREQGRNKGSADFFADKRTREKLREQCRDAVTSDSFMAGLMRLAVNNILGSSDAVTGFKPKAKTGDDEFDDQAEKMFREWAYSRADASNRWTLRDMAEQVLRAKWRDGEIFNVMIGKAPRKGYTQLIESERVTQPGKKRIGELKDGHKVEQGIHMNRWGSPQRYWVADRNNTGHFVRSEKGDWVSAQDMLHIYRPNRYSQTRGVPDFAPLLDDVQMLNQYMEAELMSAHVAACMAVWIPDASGKKRENRSNTSDWGRNDDGSDGGSTPQYETVQPGRFHYGMPNEGEPKVIDPKKPPEQFDEFYTALARVAMFGLGLPLEIFNWGATAYSTARSAMEQAKRRFQVSQNFLINHYYRPLYQWKISQFIKHEGLKEPEQGEPWDHTWVTPGWPGMKEKDEAEAAATKLDKGMTSLEIEAGKKGMEAEDILQQRRRLYERAEQIAEESGMDVEWLIGTRGQKQ